jgi:hypothetical protein
MRIKDGPRTLTARQNYLLARIPSQHSLNGFHVPVEPKEVKQARKLIERYDKQIALQRCAHDKRIEALIRKAREAVYFADDVKALAIVQQVEKMMKGCEV